MNVIDDYVVDAIERWATVLAINLSGKNNGCSIVWEPSGSILKAEGGIFASVTRKSWSTICPPFALWLVKLWKQRTIANWGSSSARRSIISNSCASSHPTVRWAKKVLLNLNGNCVFSLVVTPHASPSTRKRMQQGKNSPRLNCEFSDGFSELVQ